MLSTTYEAFLGLKPSSRRMLLNVLYVTFIFAYAMPPLLILGIFFMPLGLVGMLMAQRKNDLFVYSMPTSSEVAEILKEKEKKFHALAVLGYTVFLPCGLCFLMGFTWFLVDNVYYAAFFLLSFLWMYWRYFDLYEKVSRI